MSKKSNSKVSKKARTASKTTAAYWSGKVRLEKKPGWESSNYFVRIQADGLRRKVKLNSTVKEEAAREAAELYIEVLARGWPKEDEERLPLPGGSSLPENPTIDDWIKAVKAKKLVSDPSIQKYGESLETIVGEILKIPRSRKPEQRARIKGYLVTSLTKLTLTEWLDKRKARAGELDVIAAKQALNTTRSLMINARSLFSERVLESLEIDTDKVPCIPFSKIKLPPKGSRRYISRFNARRLLECASHELGSTNADDPRFEQWKIFYLSLVAGLRYKEIDQLQIYDIQLDKCQIAVRPHQTFATKTEASIGEVEIDESAAKILEQMVRQTSGPWFVKGGTSSKSKKYRAGLHHDAVVAWLRNYEDNGNRPFEKIRKPLHELRKEAGTLVNKAHGLVGAKNFLRHASITTTAEFYVDNVGPVTTGLA